MSTTRVSLIETTVRCDNCGKVVKDVREEGDKRYYPEGWLSRMPWSWDNDIDVCSPECARPLFDKWVTQVAALVEA